MEPNERHQQQQHQSLSSPYFHHHHHLQQHHPTGNAVPSSNNGLFPPPPQQHQQPNDGSSSQAVYPHSVPSSAVTAPAEPLKRKRGRPRKYVTPEQALEAKKMASAASSSSAKERREQAAAAGGGTASSNSMPSSKKSQLGSAGKTGQSFTPHIVNIAPGEDVAQKIVMFAQQSKHELCVLSASGTISTASLRQPGGNISYEGQYEIISLSGSFIRAEQGGKTGGLGVSLSRSDGQIIGGAVGTHLIAAGPVQVILGTFQLDRKKDGVKGEASNSGSRLTSPSSTGPGPGPGPLLGMGFRSVMESPERNPMRGNDEQHHPHQQTGMGGSHHFMMQAPQGMHMTHSRPSEWGGGGNSGHDGRGGGGGGGGGYDLSGRLGHESSENGDYEQQLPD